jgi:hypothetical protein
MSEQPEPILVRASINLPGLSLGALAWVDPEAPYIATCLEYGYLQPLEEEPGGSS